MKHFRGFTTFFQEFDGEDEDLEEDDDWNDAALVCILKLILVIYHF